MPHNMLRVILARLFTQGHGVQRRLRPWVQDARTLLRTPVPWHALAVAPPQALRIETTNLCNARCVFCAYPKLDPENTVKGVMSDTLFEKTLQDYLAMGGRAVTFAPLLGEPLADIKVITRIARAKALGFWVSMHTNGIRLGCIDVHELVQTGIDRIEVACSPLERTCHEQIYRTDHYEELLRGLTALLEARNRLATSLEVHIAFRGFAPRRETLDQPDFVRHIVPLLTPHERRLVTSPYNGYQDWNGHVTGEDLVEGMQFALPPHLKTRPCRMTLTPVVLWDGRVWACPCASADVPRDRDDLCVGDLNTHSLEDIWHGRPLRQLRRRFIRNDLLPVCRNCSCYISC